MTRRTRVVVLYGGRSAEHEISCRSAAFVLRNLNPQRYEVHCIAIDKYGNWLPQDTERLLNGLENVLPIVSKEPLARMPALPTNEQEAGRALNPLQLRGTTTDGGEVETVFFPVLHGTFGEDGTLQGLFDLAEVAYVGPDTLGSAVGMDKVSAKRLALASGIPTGPFLAFRAYEVEQDLAAVTKRIWQELGEKLFVKPARLGSSIGISRVTAKQDLEAAMRKALEYDDKLIVEKAFNVREIECAVLGDYDPKVSIPGEVVPKVDFYSYEAKYLTDDGAALLIPADLTAPQVEEAQSMSKKIFMALDLYGMARVDLFLDKDSGAFLFNEVNTIPGFTEISQFPMLWKESGLDGPALVDELLRLALERRMKRAALKRTRV